VKQVAILLFALLLVAAAVWLQQVDDVASMRDPSRTERPRTSNDSSTLAYSEIMAKQPR